MKEISRALEAGEIQPGKAFQQIIVIRQAWSDAQPKPAARAGGGKRAGGKPVNASAGKGKAKGKGGKKAEAAAARKPITVSENKLSTFARFEAASARLDRLVADGEITREVANQRLKAVQKQLAEASGHKVERVEDLPRYKREKGRLEGQVRAGKMSIDQMNGELSKLRRLLKSTGQVPAPQKKGAGKKPAAKKPAAKKPAAKKPSGRKPAPEKPGGQRRARGSGGASR